MMNYNVDSFYKDEDFTPFRNIMNEWYARDTSRKIKSTPCVLPKRNRIKSNPIFLGKPISN
ncbi:hypothetical protein HMPREF0378_1707 [Eubacterium nodatum ATCC 33099]|nr:hypothetical protein HMPREF0378_1707 [Eubacterium nodatum ATCC 33099]